MTKQQEAERREAIKEIRKYVKRGQVVYTLLQHVSASGMSRSISLYVIRQNKPVRLDYWATKVLGRSFDQKNGGLKVGGCGMDMGFSLVYDLGRALWPKGFKTPKGYWRNEPLTFDPDGGYALKHEWLG